MKRGMIALMTLILTSCNTHAPAWTDNRLIAHACGGITDLNGANSMEALITNINNGHKVFEIDLLMTRDKEIAAIHDFESYNNGKSEPLTRAEFKNIKIYGVFNTMDFDEILNIMKEHEDIYIVTDTKSYDDDAAYIKEHFEIMRDKALVVDESLLDRIIPQIYNQQMYDIIKEVYPFPSIIYTLYQSPDTDAEVIDFVSDKEDIQVITMAPQRFSDSFYKELKRKGKFIYLFTLNDRQEVNEYFKKGVTGVYTDFIKP